MGYWETEVLARGFTIRCILASPKMWATFLQLLCLFFFVFVFAKWKLQTFIKMLSSSIDQQSRAARRAQPGRECSAGGHRAHCTASNQTSLKHAMLLTSCVFEQSKPTNKRFHNHRFFGSLKHDDLVSYSYYKPLLGSISWSKEASRGFKGRWGVYFL